MAKSTQRTCIGVKTIVKNDKKIITFKCFSDGDIEKYEYIEDTEVTDWQIIGNGKGAEKSVGECIGFSIHSFEDNSYLAVRWFKSGLVQQSHPGTGMWITVKRVVHK